MKSLKKLKGEIVMTTDEAIELLKNIRDYLSAGNPIYDKDKIKDAFNMAIEALTNSFGDCWIPQ